MTVMKEQYTCYFYEFSNTGIPFLQNWVWVLALKSDGLRVAVDYELSREGNW